MKAARKSSATGGRPAKAARRFGAALALALAAGLPLSGLHQGPPAELFLRAAVLGLTAAAAFTLFEAWPRRLPPFLERWVLQVAAAGAAMPLVTIAFHTLALRPPASAPAPPFWQSHDWLLLTFAAMLIAPWTALAAIVRQKDAFARNQELRFALERSELERQALDARLRLLQAQVAPHFLFNTLANVQALVDAGSPRAAELLRSLIAYLRAAVPRLDESAATIEHELQLVRPYLELMQMRMPDRLEYQLEVDPAALGVRCPPTTLLTLVENAVRHGIDPSEDGGRIAVAIRRAGESCLIRIADTGAGLQPAAESPGTGLATLRERLRLAFGDAARLRLVPGAPSGVAVEVELPA